VKLLPATLGFVLAAVAIQSDGAAGAAKQPQQQVGGVADPAKWVAGAYVPTKAGSGAEDLPDSQNQAYTPRLRGLFADEAKHPDGDIGRLEFDYLTGAQDEDIKDVKVSEQAVDYAPDRKVVVAEFRNIDKPTTIDFMFERSGGRWYLDDVHSATDGWTLSTILKYGQY
jgi:hypothetical protein